MAGLPAEFHPAIGRDAGTVAGLSREADGSICAVWLAAIGGLALAFLLFFEPAGLTAAMIYANAGGLALCSVETVTSLRLTPVRPRPSQPGCWRWRCGAGRSR